VSLRRLGNMLLPTIAGLLRRTQVVGGKIGQLEARKRLAVEREDYDLAKALKADIEKLRSAGEAAALSSPPGSGQAWANVPAGAAARQQQAEGGGGGAGSSSAGGFLSGDAAQLLQQRASDAAAAGAEGGGGGYADMYAADGADGLPDDEGAAAAGQQQLLHTYQAYEDRPAVAKAAFIGRLGSGASADGGGAAGGDAAALGDMDDEALIRADPSRVSAAAMFGSASGGSKKALHVSGGGGSRLSGGGPGSLLAAAGVAVGGGGAPAGARDEGCGAAPPQGWPSDLPAPEPLTPVSASDAGPVIDLAGEFVAAAFFSRAWQLRDAAAAWLADLVGSKQRLSGGGAEQREAARGLVRLSVKALKDKVPQVYSSNLSLLQVRAARCWFVDEPARASAAAGCACAQPVAVALCASR
jgi:centrosomal protein CEP104